MPGRSHPHPAGMRGLWGPRGDAPRRAPTAQPISCPSHPEGAPSFGHVAPCGAGSPCPQAAVRWGSEGTVMGGGTTRSGRLGVSHTPAVTAARQKPGVLCSHAKGGHDGGDHSGWGQLSLVPREGHPTAAPIPAVTGYQPGTRAPAHPCAPGLQHLLWEQPLLLLPLPPPWHRC